MPHVSYLQPQDAAEKVKETLDRIENKTGQVPHMLQLLGHSPELFHAFLPFTNSVRSMELDAGLRELAYLMVAHRLGCEVCTHHHMGLARKADLTEAQVSDLDSYETSDAYDEVQRSVLTFADQVTTKGRAYGALVQSLHEFLGDRCVVELAAVVAMANFTGRFNVSLGTEVP